MSALSVQTMTGLLTQPYQRGGETLELTLAADVGGFTPVAPYDFKLYRVRYQESPAEPQYIVYNKLQIPPTGLMLRVFYQFGGTETSTVITLPGEAFAGSSFAIPLPAGADGTLRITRLKQLPVPLAGAGSANFGIVALLGNIAKLAWVVGSEKDLIRGTLEDVRMQRHVSIAHGASLDAIGADLRVPRFPPRPYSYDTNTIALYHLDAAVANGGAVLDDTTRFGVTGHSGVNQAAQSGAIGKFGAAFEFGPTGAIEIPDHADFSLPATASFTAEGFIQLGGPAVADPALIFGKGSLTAAGDLSTPGWSLVVGTFRGFSNSLRFALFDGANAIQIFADRDLGDGQFHHVAGVIDRAGQQTRLFVDGTLCAVTDISTLGALTNAIPVRIGQSTTPAQQFSGITDEVRFSNVSRAEFDPVLGEGDIGYRKRLSIFRRWLLPDPNDLISTINGMVQINGDPNSFVLIEKTKPMAATNAQVRIIPASIAAGQFISSGGDPLAKEADVSGVASDETNFQLFYLLTYSAAGVDFGSDPNNKLMQSVTSVALDSLLNLLAAANPPLAGNLQVSKSFDSTNSGLHGVGRALRMTHTTLTPEKLAVFVHRAGFTFVQNSGTDVYASVATGEMLRIVVEPRAASEIPTDGSDAFVGHQFNLHVAQGGLPVAGLYNWVVIPWASGRASLRPHPADAPTLTTPVRNRPHVQVSADGPGEITVRVEYALSRSTVTGTLDLNFTVSSLADTTSITADGNTSASETDIIGVPAGTINPIYLITSTLGINFGADPNNKRMQIGLEKPLTRLVGLLGANAATLQVLKSFDPADTGFFKLGRAIRLTHPTLDPGALGAFAHQAGFDFASRQAAQIYCSVADSDKIQIANAPALTPVAQELVVGTPVPLQARFSTLPAGGSYNWSSSQVGNGQGTFDFVLRSTVTFTPKKTGFLQLSLFYSEVDPNSEAPFTFEIRLNDALNVPATIIPKTQYDLLMNILNYFHPIGVEVITLQVRQHVVEVRENLLNAFPGYTYPDFRV